MKHIGITLTLMVQLGCSGDHANDEQDSETPPGIEEPILESPGTTTVDCAVSRDLTSLEIGWYDFDLAQSDDGAYLLRSEYSDDDASRIAWSPLSMDGTLGPSSSTDEEPEVLENATYTAIAEDNNGYALAWFEGWNTKSLNLLRTDPSGIIEEQPESLLTTAGRTGALTLLTAENGHAMLWISSDTNRPKLEFAVVGEDNTLSVPPRTIIESTEIGDIYHFNLDAAVRFDDSYAVAFTATFSTGAGKKSYFLILDSNGDPAGELNLLSDHAASAGWDSPASDILVRDDYFLLAWSENIQVEGDVLNGLAEARNIIRIARFSREGELDSPVYTLKEPENFQECVNPTWVEMGDDLGLMWSEGSYITVCGGCTPDNVLNFVVLDSETLFPKSDVVTLSSDEDYPGLLSQKVVRHGNDLLVVANIQYHTSAEGASGTITCK